MEKDFFISFRQALLDFIPNHGLTQNILKELNDEWNTKVYEKGIIENHIALLKYSDALTFFRDEFPRIQQKSVSLIQSQIAVLQAQLQSQLLALQNLKNITI